MAEEAYSSISDKEVQEDVDSMIDEIISALTTPVEAGVEQLEMPITTPGGPSPLTGETTRFTAENYDKLYDKFNATFLEYGWGDGFMLTPPTRPRVDEMMKGTSHPADEVVVKHFEPAKGEATVEKIAIAAVMAGCKPEYLPVVLAAIEALSDPAFDLIQVSMSTGAHTPFLFVNGPIRDEIGINYKAGPLGPGSRNHVNATIGRAVRLVMMNIGGCYLGIKDMDVLGTSNKFGMLIGENEEANPWEPYHVEIGYDPKTSVISALGMDSQNETALASVEPEVLLYYYATVMCDFGGGALACAHFFDADTLILMNPDHAKTVAESGWSKNDVRGFLFKTCGVTEHELTAGGRADIMPAYLETWQALGRQAGEKLPCVKSSERIKIIVAGAGPLKGSNISGIGRLVTKEIDKWK
ncbi:MAG: hypothetical protein JSV02_00350 [Dehalococcoidia bacterium]|nr:MAG: hypothetical protein JSV02_00350 [Dehalococcoidia bacterium]